MSWVNFAESLQSGLFVEYGHCEFDALGLTETAGAAPAAAPDQNRNVLVARQSDKYLEEPTGLNIHLLYIIARCEIR